MQKNNPKYLYTAQICNLILMDGLFQMIDRRNPEEVERTQII